MLARGMSAAKEVVHSQVFLTRLPSNCSREVLRPILNQLGDVLDLKYVPANERQSAFARVTFSTTLAAQHALSRLPAVLQQKGYEGVRADPPRAPQPKLAETYAAPVLNRAEHESYKAAGLLPFRVGTGGAVEVLLGLEERDGELCLGFLAGKREPADAHAGVTAVREFWEESGMVMGSSFVERLSSQLAPISTEGGGAAAATTAAVAASAAASSETSPLAAVAALTDSMAALSVTARASPASASPSGAFCLWILQAKMALFVLPWDRVSAHADSATADIVQLHADFLAARRSEADLLASTGVDIMRSLHWLPLQAVMAASAGGFSRVLRSGNGVASSPSPTKQNTKPLLEVPTSSDPSTTVAVGLARFIKEVLRDPVVSDRMRTLALGGGGQGAAATSLGSADSASNSGSSSSGGGAYLAPVMRDSFDLSLFLAGAGRSNVSWRFARSIQHATPASAAVVDGTAVWKPVRIPPTAAAAQAAGIIADLMAEINKRGKTNVSLFEYCEQGTMQWSLMPEPQPVSQRYHWLFDKRERGAASVFFHDTGMLFHTLDFASAEAEGEAARVSVEHFCSPDTYAGAFALRDTRSHARTLRVTWKVRGPKKDYVSTTDYTVDATSTANAATTAQSGERADDTRGRGGGRGGSGGSRGGRGGPGAGRGGASGGASSSGGWRNSEH
jgi:hypothetical protein